jgi:DNA-binding NarL/FixJ family response regulator
MQQKPVRVVILEDLQNSLDGFFFRLQNNPDILIEQTFAVYAPFRAYMRKHSADVVILDLGVPESEDNPNNFPLFVAINELIDRRPELSIMIVSAHHERAMIDLTLAAGANAYILKNDVESIKNLAEIVIQVAQDEVVIPELTMAILRKHAEGMPDLTPRQLDALSIIVAHPDRPQKELADLLAVKHSTFRNLISQAYIRLGVGSRLQAQRKVIELGILPNRDNGSPRSEGSN